MNTTLKRALAVVCGLAAAATWIPVLLQDDADAPAPNPDIPAEAGLVAAGVPLSSGALEAKPASPGASGPAAPTSHSGATGTLDLTSLQSDGAGEKKSSTDELLARLALSWTDEPEDSKSLGSTTEGRESTGQPAFATETFSGEQEGESVPEDPAAVFLREHALRGSLITATSRTALFGELIVREGDVIASGALRVLRIDARAVTFARGDVEHVVELAAFHPNPARTSSTKSMLPGATPTSGPSFTPMPSVTPMPSMPAAATPSAAPPTTTGEPKS